MDSALIHEPVYYSQDEWRALLKLSTRFRCFDLRKEAIRQLESYWKRGFIPFPDETIPIQMGREFFIRQWVVNGYKALVERMATISDEEVLKINTMEAFRLMRIRELRNKSEALDVNVAIQKAFGVELNLISDEEIKYTSESSKVATRVLSYSTWVEEAQTRTDELHNCRTIGPVTWILADGASIPKVATVAGQESDGQNLYINRAFHEVTVFSKKSSCLISFNCRKIKDALGELPFPDAFCFNLQHPLQ